MTPEIARERVARGAALLDEKIPGWFRSVDVDTLQISSCHLCVLGQLSGSTGGNYIAGTFSRMCDQLFPVDRGDGPSTH